MDFQISAILSTKFTGMAFHSLFQSVGFSVFWELRKFAHIVKLRSWFFSLKPVSVKGCSFPSCYGIVCDCRQSSNTISALDFVNVCFILTGKCLVHTVLHKIGEPAYLKGIICYGIVVIKSTNFRIISCQNLYIAMDYQFSPVKGYKSILSIFVNLDFDCMIFQ